jgi:hypothetical protein
VLALAGCGQAPVAAHPSDRASAPAQQAPTAAPTPPPAAAPPAAAPPTAAPPPPPTAAPTPVPPALSLDFAPGSVTVSVSGVASGEHQVHVHRDCTGNPDLHITTLGSVFVSSDGSGSRTFSLASSLRARGFDLLVYPLGASQGPPTLCTGI